MFCFKLDIRNKKTGVKIHKRIHIKVFKYLTWIYMLWSQKGIKIHSTMILLLNPPCHRSGRTFCQCVWSSVLTLVRNLLSRLYLPLFWVLCLTLPCVLGLFSLVFTCSVIPSLRRLRYLHINCTKYISNHSSRLCTPRQLVSSVTIFSLIH